MIHGIGTDIVSVERMAMALQRHGERFAQRILSDSELEEFRQRRNQAGFLAKRFAAKEALVKALGTGFRDDMGFRQITIDHDELGRPCFRCQGAVSACLQRLAIRELQLSLSDELTYAVAFAIALK